MRYRRVGHRGRQPGGRALPELPRLVGSGAQRNDSLHPGANQQCVEPAVAIPDQARVFPGGRLHAAIDAVEVRVDEYVAPA